MKYSDAPGTTKSMRIAIEDLGLTKLFVVYPGMTSYDIDEKVRVVSIQSLDSELARTLKKP